MKLFADLSSIQLLVQVIVEVLIQRYIYKYKRFDDHDQYLLAKKVGAKNFKELQKIYDYNAPDYHTVKEIKKGKFPDHETYIKAVNKGHSDFKMNNNSLLRKKKLPLLQKRFARISLTNFISYLEFDSENEAIEWIVNLPQEMELRVDEDFVIFKQDERKMNFDQGDAEFTNFVKEMETKKQKRNNY